MNDGDLSEDPLFIALQGRMEQNKWAFCGMTYAIMSGPHDGEIFYMVNDGKKAFWISNSRQGIFRHVIVPEDFEHPAIIV